MTLFATLQATAKVSKKDPDCRKRLTRPATKPPTCPPFLMLLVTDQVDSLLLNKFHMGFTCVVPTA